MKIKNFQPKADRPRDEKLKIKSRYFPQDIEPKWQEIWQKEGLYKFSSKHGKKPHSVPNFAKASLEKKASRGKYYNLVELPYPSGDLHLGHWFAFVPPDAHARYKRMAGFDVFFPNGFDAFGLPAENAAIKRGVHPKDWTMKNIKTMTKQFQTMGTMIDWDYTAITCLPEYYKWNQWIFLKMFEKGLAYRGKALSNWCEVDKTVLANEHIEGGKCWRCGSEVIQKEVEQWFLKITDYAERLIWPENIEAVGRQSRFSDDARMGLALRSSSELDESSNASVPASAAGGLGIRSPAATLTKTSSHRTTPRAYELENHQSSIVNHKSFIDWPKQVIEGQNNWIGKSEGLVIDFPIAEKSNYVLLHGFTGSSREGFFPWLEKELRNEGGQVYNPDLPNTNNPNIGEQVDYVLSNYGFNENTILLGHSLGTITALKILEKLKKPIKKLVLAAAFIEPGFLDHGRVFEKTFDWKFDFEKIKRNAGEIVILRDINDSAVPFDRAEKVQEKIGGTIVDFEAKGDHITGEKEPVVLKNLKQSLEVFTTRPETADGATFLVVAPEHQFVQKLLDKNFKFKISNLKLKEIREYVEEAKKKTEMERKEDRTKSGIFSGAYVKNPVTGKDIPVWISDYVLAGYGTGAIMAVPFADERDREFAEKFNLPIEKTSFKAKPKGEKKVNYHLRDWSISRQRYWGTPIPIIYCKSCARGPVRSFPPASAPNPFGEPSAQSVRAVGSPSTSATPFNVSVIDGEEYAMVPVPLEDLPIELPYNVDYTPKGKPPLASDEEWLNVKCPKCKGKAKRDAETLDTFFDSSWYFYRYVSPHYDKLPFDREKVKELLPVDVYFGGSEHTLGHTLYARFFTKVFKDMGLLDFDEFAAKRVQHGVVLGPDGNRMSKSKGNVVSPDEIVKEYGADAVRLYLCFMMPYEATAPWSVGAINGIYRFLKRVWQLQSAISNQQSAISSEDLTQMHKAIKKVGDDLNNFQFNTAVAALMTWLNFLSAKDTIAKEEYETFLKLLAPFAPHLTEEIWQMINSSDNRQSEDPVVGRQLRFSDDARSSFPKNQSQTRSLSESRLSNSKDNQSGQEPSFGSPQSELPPDTTKASHLNNLAMQPASRRDRQFSNFNSIHLENWPKFDPKYLVTDEFSIVVQVNGKLRDSIRVESSKLKVQSFVEDEAGKSEKVQKYLQGKKIKKVIYVEGRLINFVIG